MQGPILIPITDRAALLARVHLGVTTPLLALTLVPFLARVRMRIWPVWRVRLDDWLIIIGFASAVTDWALLHKEMITQPGFISPEQAISTVKLSYAAIVVWGLTMTCVKTSATVTLLRIPQSFFSTFMLYLILVLQLVYFVGDTVYILAIKCRPLQKAWDFTVVEGMCVNPATDVIVSNIGSAINITTDVFLSLAPMAILWNLRRPLRERILVCGLTGIGLLASLASVAKLIVFQQWGTHPDSWALAMSIATWTVAEQFIAIVAACSPSIKGPVQRALGKVGILITRYDSRISFIYMPTQGRGPHGSIYERQADEEVGGYPGLITGNVALDQTLDKSERDASTRASASMSGSTLKESGAAGGTTR